MEEQKSIKESMELLEGLKVVAVNAKKVMADGKVGADDLAVLLAMVQEVGVLVAAVQGASEIKAEVSELSDEELKQLAAKVLEIVAVVRAA